MVKLTDRLRAGLRAFRGSGSRFGSGSGSGFGSGSDSGLGASEKDLPFAWPTTYNGKVQWHLVDYSAYVREGYAMNTLVYSAIMYKVRAIMSAPLKAYSGTLESPGKVDPNSDLNQLFKNPNKNQSWVEFQARNIVFLNLAGNVYIYVDPFTQEMHSLSPDRMYIVTNKEIPAGLAGYLYVPEGASPTDWERGIRFLPEDIMHIKLPNPADPLEGLGYGLSPLQPAAQSIDVDNMVTKFLNIFFERGGMVTGVLQYDIPLSRTVADQILERWNQKYGGIENWQVGILDRGATYQRTTMTFEEMGFEGVDGRGETRILSPFGVAPILVGAKVGLDSSTYSNYEAARQAVWEDTLVPELTWFEVEYQNRFNTDTEFVMFDFSRVPALQRALPRQVDAAYTMIQSGVPPNLAYRVVGLRLGDIPDGDKPKEMTSGRGQNQGPTSNGETDGWGQRDDVPE